MYIFIIVFIAVIYNNTTYASTQKTTKPTKSVKASPKTKPIVVKKIINKTKPISTNLLTPTNDVIQALAHEVVVGKFNCFDRQSITLTHRTDMIGYIDLLFKGKTYIMVPVESKTGAVRLETVKGIKNQKEDFYFLQLSAKSMLFNARLGNRIVDDCQPEITDKKDIIIDNNIKEIKEVKDNIINSPIEVISDNKNTINTINTINNKDVMIDKDIKNIKDMKDIK